MKIIKVMPQFIVSL